MRITSLLSVVAIVGAVTLAQGVLTTAFAADAPQAQAQVNRQSNTGPYDSPDFIVAPSDIHP